MWKRLLHYREKRNQLQRLDRFRDDIQRYRADVLRPLSLDAMGDEPHWSKRRRQVFLGEERVWKFYRTSRRDARNFVAAARILKEHGIPAPRVEYSDVSSKTRDEYRLSCIVMNRLEGTILKDLPEEVQKQHEATFLARLHAVTSPAWGECFDLKSDGYFNDLFVRRIEKRRQPIEEGYRTVLQKSPPAFLEWLGGWRERLRPLEGAYRMVSSDVSAHNFMIGADERVAIIDLDRTRFLDFPVDLVQLLNLNASAKLLDRSESAAKLMNRIEDRVSETLDAYFAGVPADFREHWNRVRVPYTAAHLWSLLYGRLRANEAKFSTGSKYEARENQVFVEGIANVLEKLMEKT